jgi:rRNA maturation RNase YbeY
MERTARLEPERIWEALSVALLDDAGITRVNALHLDKARSTDVISYAYPPMMPAENWSGEVLVNAEMAQREGAARGDVAGELALYLAHGCDHLSGADDHDERDRRRMRRRELRWLREIGYGDLLC